MQADQHAHARRERPPEIGRSRAASHDALIDTPDQGRAVDKRLFAYLDLRAELRKRGSNEPTPPPVDPGPPAA